jgi:prevent-host-death family protein
MPKSGRRKGRSWALQDAKNRLSEVVNAAVRGEPQIVTRRGVETAVIISRDEFERVRGGRPDPSALEERFVAVANSAEAEDQSGTSADDGALLLAEVTSIQQFVADLPDRETRSPDEILGYDDTGLAS